MVSSVAIRNLVVTTLLLGALVTAGPALPLAPGAEAFERFVIVSHTKNPINAYPCLSRLSDGRLLLVWCSAPLEQCTGSILGAFSGDFGRTWTEPTLLLAASPVPAGDPSTVVSGQRIIVTATVPHGPGIATTTITAIRSDDNGQTWSPPYQIPMNHRYICGKIHPGARLKSGRLLMGYSWDVILEQGKTLQFESQMHTRTGAMISTDNGLTWRNGGDFDAAYQRVSADVGRGVVEPAMVELDDGSIYMLVRTGSDHLYQARSVDEGKTWTEIGPSPLRGSNAPAALCKFQAGQRRGMLCVWDNAIERFPLCAAASFDGGKTWSKPKDIAGPTDGREASYPGCDQAADGTLVAVWQQEVALGRDIRCARFTLDWLLQDQASVK